MLNARFFTPDVRDASGWQHAGGELVVGKTRLCFLVDLDHWNARDYLAQWREGISRLKRGESSTAFMTAYRGPKGRSHVLWALWRDDTHIYVQEHALHIDEMETPFDPMTPYEHIGAHVPTAVNGLPIPEWHVPIAELGGSLAGLRSS